MRGSGPVEEADEACLEDEHNSNSSTLSIECSDLVAHVGYIRSIYRDRSLD